MLFVQCHKIYVRAGRHSSTRSYTMVLYCCTCTLSLRNTVYKERDMSISATCWKNPYCCLYSCTLNYWYSTTSCMFLSQARKGQVNEICNSSDLCWNPLCWQSMASSTNLAESCSMILCAEHCPDTGQGTVRYLPSQQIPCCEQRTSHITATVINQYQYTSSLLLHLSDYTKQVGSSTIFVVFLSPSRTVHESITYIQIKSSTTLAPPNGPKQSMFCTFTWWWKQRQFQSTVYSNQCKCIISNTLLLATTESELADSITY
jgi:hypothetical protein